MTRCKTLTVVAVTATMGLALAACGSSSSGGSGGGAKTADLVISTLSNPFFVSLKNGMQAQAKTDGYTLNVQNANNSDTTELNFVTTDLAKKPSVLILDPTSSNAAAASVKQANAASVPVVAFDRKPESGSFKAFVGYNAIAAGQRAADALAKALSDKGDVVEIEGILGTNVAQDRHTGFSTEIAKFPNIHVVAAQSANFDQATALDTTTNILQAHPNIQGVYAANDEMALGVVAALKSRNLVGKVALVGNDGIEQALAAVKSGQMVATNAESAYAEGQRVADLANDVLTGKTIPQSSETLEGTLVTAANLTAYAQHLVSIGDSADVPPGLQ
jgi:ribose transport system substrate-binding protein